VFRKIQTRLEFKILLLILAVLLGGFGSYVILTIQKESDALLNEHQGKLQLFSETMMAGIRNVMLTGKAPIASAFVNDARENLSFGSVTIYDQKGKEVFLREGEGMRKNINDPMVQSVLSSREMKSTMMNDGNEAMWTRYEPLMNQQQCWRCHERKEQLRGVLQLALHPDVIQTGDNDNAAKQMSKEIGNVLATGFRTIMIGGKGEEVDTLIENANVIPAIAQAQVYDRFGSLVYGSSKNEAEQNNLVEILKTKSESILFEENGKLLRSFIPLKNEERCQVCHGAGNPMRGVLVVGFYKDSLLQFLSDHPKRYTTVLQEAVLEGFQSIMLVGKASSARNYMDELRTIPSIHTLRVFDTEGNERFLNPLPRERTQLPEILKTRKPLEFFEKINGEDFMVRLSVLPNENRCYTCHGKNNDVRAVVEVSSSMKTINAAINANKIRSVVIGFLTALFIWFAIRLFMRSVVVNPVRAIEAVASKVGQGNFSAHANLNSLDEIGNLGRSVNDMVQGLRERFHLEKFVSQQTVDAVKRADMQGIKLGGERKVATVFFSDIRGFTAFSEKVEPEKVVSMLNIYLSKQTEIVRKFGGDIDKYVGDELVAVFEGSAMVENAIRAALEIQETLKIFSEMESTSIAVGIGINTGEMIMGAMGSAERMDYTVIGDNVNLGARLCSAAKGGQILLSEFSVNVLQERALFNLLSLEPLVVKGKEHPVNVYEVQ